ncbi:alpha/beta fold hydrolase [Amycolatopsis anabasis]|uniref:alpha/beta fold hydrolase n=1 Tax=Amycolatopsis anabasis TaxID=1840409 RepID=UPI00131B32F0|nr:alpha/beta hydrolase [Amycolatopsis anabasis]
MPEVELSTGTVEYQDTGGTGPVLVLVHGVLMNGTLWRDVVRELRTDHRCVVPTLPLGGHRLATRPGAELTLTSVARLLGELLAVLDLRAVTLVGNDTGGALAQILVAENPDRIGRLVLASCEAFDNFPPGLPGRVSVLAARVPGGLWFAAQQLRLAPLRRLPVTFGWMAKRPIPDEILTDWIRGMRGDPAIRRDFRRFVRGGEPRRELREATGKLPAFGGPALVVWAAEDKVMPPGHGRRLAELLPAGRLVEIPDSYTLLPLDQPERLASELRCFVSARP